jgi:hypothetical protein
MRADGFKTAKALGLDLPPMLLAPRRRGDRMTVCATGDACRGMEIDARTGIQRP